VAAEAARAKEIAGERGRGLLGWHAAGEVRAGAGGERVEARERRRGVELRGADARDRGRAAREGGALAGGAARRAAAAWRRDGQRGSQSSMTLPSGSRTQSWVSPKARNGTPRASSVRFTSATLSTSKARCRAVGSMPSSEIVSAIRWSWLSPTAYHSPG